MRLDAALVARGVARSRERAKEMIKAGNVTVNGKTATKPSDEVSEADEIVSSEEERFVGRGALKLEKAINEFAIDLNGKVCLDIGASTGGFTEYALSRGAKKVYAVDVGRGQLAKSLREDPRVINMEETDIRDVRVVDLGSPADFISVDVSFISLRHVLPKAAELAGENASAAILIKPQFEAGKSDIGKRGVVKDKKAHVRVLEEIDAFAASVGLIAKGYVCSPIKGGSGNIEYLGYFTKQPGEPVATDFKALVEGAFRSL